MHADPASPPAAFADALERWFALHQKDYPWRRTRDPYAILVAEVMLQQTQIPTVLDRGYYSRWLERFPDFQTLASASTEEVLSAWEGLGYYRRARNLQKLAQCVVEKHGGVMPRDPRVIVALPGIGPYTAGAVASFAFDLPEPIVDGNVARVLARVFDDATPIDSGAGKRLLWERALVLVRAASSPANFNSALMELGQTHCRVAEAACEACPVRTFCRATQPLTLPAKSKRTAITEVSEHVFFMRNSAGHVLLEQETGTRRTGMWKLPDLPDTEPRPRVIHKLVYGITRYKVTLWVHTAPPNVALQTTHRLVSIQELPGLPMPAPYRRALKAALAAEMPFALE